MTISWKNCPLSSRTHIWSTLFYANSKTCNHVRKNTTYWTCPQAMCLRKCCDRLSKMWTNWPRRQTSSWTITNKCKNKIIWNNSICKREYVLTLMLLIKSILYYLIDLKIKEAENSARRARGEPPLPDEDLNKLFKPIPALSRLESLLISNQIKNYSQQINEFTAQSFSNLFIAESLQNK